MLLQFASLLFLWGMLILAAAIPRERIRENMLQSAEYLADAPMFFCVNEGNMATRIDRYADAILLSICYGYDDNQKLQSVLYSGYYEKGMQDANECLLEHIRDDMEPNQEYMRYWHGSIAFVRPLFLLFTLRQIYILNAILLGILFASLLYRFIRNKKWSLAGAFLLGACLTMSWFVPWSLEYTWMYYIWLIGCHMAFTMTKRKLYSGAGYLFLLLGIITNYLDFLTTETMSLLLPLMIMVAAQKEEGQPFLEAAKMTVSNALLWGTGYIGMWISKWVLASLCLGENMVSFVKGHVEQRLDGDVGLPLISYMYYAVVKNVRLLFPFNMGAGGILLFFCMLLLVGYFLFVYRKEQQGKRYFLLLGGLVLIPYVRYLILHNHAYIHFFFTYRAQMAVVAGLSLMVSESVDWRCLWHDIRKKR